MKDKPGSLQPVSKHADGRISVIAAIIGNILVGIVKFIAAAISGSAAMVSEGIHSIVDSGNGVLVLFGMNRSKKEPDYLHPFGYGAQSRAYCQTLRRDEADAAEAPAGKGQQA